MRLAFTLAMMAGPVTSVWKGKASAEYELTKDPKPLLIGPNNSFENLDKELVIIRTYLPSEAMKARFRRIISELDDREVIISTSEHSDKGVWLTSNADGTKREVAGHMPPEHYVPMMQREFEGHAQMMKEFGPRVFVYTDEMVDEKFPTMKVLPKLPIHLYDDPELGTQWYDAPYGKLFFNEAMRMAIDQYTERTHLIPNKGVWMIVDDVEYTGNWKKLLNKYNLEGLNATQYEQRGGTLVSADNKPSPWVNEAYWNRFTSAAFKNNYVKGEHVYKHTEQVVYYSSRFLEVLNKAMHDGVHAQSEIGTGSICKWNDCQRYNISYDYDLDNAGYHLATRFPFAFGSTLSVDGILCRFFTNMVKEIKPEAAKARVEELWSKGEARLVHPCKW